MLQVLHRHRGSSLHLQVFGQPFFVSFSSYLSSRQLLGMVTAYGSLFASPDAPNDQPLFDVKVRVGCVL